MLSSPNPFSFAFSDHKLMLFHLLVVQLHVIFLDQYADVKVQTSALLLYKQSLSIPSCCLSLGGQKSSISVNNRNRETYEHNYQTGSGELAPQKELSIDYKSYVS